MRAIRASQVAREQQIRFNAGKTGEVIFDLIPALEDCKPGLRAVEYNLIVAVAVVSDSMGAKGLIKRTEQEMEAEQMAIQIGRVVDMSPLAFSYDEWKGCRDRIPQIGQIVWFARYAGGMIEAARDGRPYRIIKDKDVAAVIEEPLPEKPFELDSVA